jgi:hypothetical protein
MTISSQYFIMLYLLYATVQYTQISLPTSCTMFLYLLYISPTCFGHISCPSSGSYESDWCVQCIWQLVIDNWQTTYVSLICDTNVQLKICDFQEKLLKVFKCYNFLWVQRQHNCFPLASFANSLMTLYLLKVHLQTFLSIPITQKCQILSCNFLVTNKRYIQ